MRGDDGLRRAPTSLTRILAAAVTAAAGFAMAAPGGARAACPPEYLVHSSDNYSAAEVARARHGVFDVHGKRLRMRPPADWARDPDNSRRFRAALSTLSWLDVLFYDYLQNGREASLRDARDLALDWIDQNPVHDGATDRTWDDRVTATRAPYLAFALRASACEHLLDQSRQRTLRRSVKKHGQLAASDRRYRPTNHGLFVDTNLILLARSVPSISDGTGWEVTAKRRFRHTLKGRLKEQEGFWLEHSAAYQLAIRREVAFYRDLVGGTDLAALFARMTDVAAWLVEPDHDLWLLGSSNYDHVPAELRDAADAHDGLEWLPRSGLAVVQHAGGYLGAAATFFNASHKHSDDLSFELYDHGRRIVSDTGQYDKDKGPWRTFQESPQAHSTLTVDGGGFSRDGSAAYGSGMIARGSGDGWYAILAHNPLLRRRGVQHERLWLYRPGIGVLVLDRIQARGRHVYRRWFQLGTEIDAAENGGGVALSDGSWSGRLDDSSRAGVTSVSLARGRTHPEILGFEFPEFRERTPRHAVELRTSGEDRKLLTILATDPVQRLDAQLVRAGETRTELDLTLGGLAAGTLEVRRTGDSLDVGVDP